MGEVEFSVALNSPLPCSSHVKLRALTAHKYKFDPVVLYDVAVKYVAVSKAASNAVDGDCPGSLCSFAHSGYIISY